MRLKSDVKFEETLILWFQKWHEELGELSLEHSKSEKLHFDMQLLSIAYKVSAKKKYRRIISHDTEKRSKLWRKTDFLFEKWHEEFSELYPELSKIRKFALWWATFVNGI